MRTEQQIEQSLIKKLEELGYRYLNNITDRLSLEKNFREHFQRLNMVNLSDSEFARLRDEIIVDDVFKSSTLLRERNLFLRDDDTPLYYTLVNIKDWCKNEFEVINQLRINTNNSHHRYDVIILMNGLPIAQIELKSNNIDPKKAMEQIVEYKNDIGNGYTNSLLCFIQLFVVSNENSTHYFANNKQEHFSFNADENYLPIYQLADEDNNKIRHLHEFSEQFFSKCTLGELISKYIVLVASDQKLLIMRPYQIYAVKHIVSSINENRGNGYIWHTTGSGKTLTSFKASTLLKDNPYIDKCLFVVDRKDLDKQTRDEFNYFQEGCVEENTDTETLVERLLSDDYKDKVIVTTIQKLGIALNEDSKRNIQQQKQGKSTYRERLLPLQNKKIVFIFDECHRSQFGDNHKAIKEFFPNSQLFGFTGTPIFSENAVIDFTSGRLQTTKDIFQNDLHDYTITHAIDDKNVLKFHIDYFKTEARSSPSKKTIVNSILDKHLSATRNTRFNAIFATSSINDAIKYYELFDEIQNEKLKHNNEYKKLNITCVFSPPVEGNKDNKQLQEDLPQEKEDYQTEPEKKKEALINIITQYNEQYNTNHNINEFDRYYQDVQKRIKDHKYTDKDYPHKNKIDIVIVVDMLLTGFDSKFLNTLYVDKNLQYHGLVQAFSRTNRILNSTKPQGNILVFKKDLETKVDGAIALFSGLGVEEGRRIWLVDEGSKLFKEYQQAIQKLQDSLSNQGLTFTPSDALNLKGDQDRLKFIADFKEIQRLRVQLDQYTDIDETHQQAIESLLPIDDMRGFRGAYLEIISRFNEEKEKKIRKKIEPQELSIDDTDTELVLFSSVMIDYDYIMGLMAKYTQHSSGVKQVNKEYIIKLLCSSSEFMDEKEDLIRYIDTLQTNAELDEETVKQNYHAFKTNDTMKKIQALAKEFHLTQDSLQEFVDTIIERMIFDGEKLTDLFVPLDLEWLDRVNQELAFMKKLVPLLKKLAEGKTISGLSAYDKRAV